MLWESKTRNSKCCFSLLTDSKRCRVRQKNMYVASEEKKLYLNMLIKNSCNFKYIVDIYSNLSLIV